MIVIEFDLVGGALGDFANHVAHSLIRLLGIDHDSFHVFGEEITHRPFDQVRFLEDARWGRLVFDSVLDVFPFLQQQRQIAHEITRLLPGANGPNDDFHPFRNGEAAQNGFQPLPFFLVLDLMGNAALVRVGQ